MILMVDFKKKLKEKTIKKKINPYDIYESLDRSIEKGPLRPVQEIILKDWYDKYKEERDVILKLHTGQGKTIVGLLMLQSRLNQETGPAIYLCPDNYLVAQTCKEAEEFGISYTLIEDELPDNFIDGKSILITSLQTVFNGLTKFKLGNKSLKVSTVLIDDAHACIEKIKDSCRVKLYSNSHAYQDILTLFGPELEKQGVGTYADIKRGIYDAYLQVPYWDWQDKHSEVASVLSKYSDSKEIRFSWPILKDIIIDCMCIISGDSLEIIPYVTPLHLFGSYYKAEHRIFMSATISNDSFFVKGLGLSPKTIQDPLSIQDEKWSGEKMILIPTLIDPSLNRTEIVNFLATPAKDRKIGVVALVPSFNRCKDWKEYGATIANKDTLLDEIEKLKNKVCDKTLVIVNRYDGIDLPDHACRLIIFDSRPYFESLYDRLIEDCRTDSEVISTRLAQIIEQGLGRAVRGEKDYCAIIITGPELVKAIRSRESTRFYSQQTNTQIEIGLEIAKYAKEEIKSGEKPLTALKGLLRQLILRDEGWKIFYTEKMNSTKKEKSDTKILDIFELEKNADVLYSDGQYENAAKKIQELIDKHIKSEEERGWYLQEIARFIYPFSKSESNKYQIAAHKKNRYLLKPKEGMQISKMTTISLRRIESIKKWIWQFSNFEDMQITLEDMLGKLRFGVKSDTFEYSMNEIAKCLGFPSQRPDKEWKEGPDNLWKVRDNEYLLVECKNKVELTRKEINKDETGQMNNACAWFNKNYGDVQVKRIMIIPTKKVSSATGFNYPVEIMRESKLKKLTENVSKFFLEFKNKDLKDLSDQKIQELINAHKLTVNDLLTLYSEEPRI